MVAWENPENKDSTVDYVEDLIEETVDEKIDTVALDIVNIKKQLGLNVNVGTGEAEFYEDQKCTAKSIKSISNNLDLLL